MKILTYEHAGATDFGIVKGDGVVALKARLPGVDGLRGLLAQGHDLRLIEDRFGGLDPDVELSRIRFLPPVLSPGKIVCVGLNYRGHVTEAGRPTMEHPTLFSRWADSHVGHNEPLILPTASPRFDYEGELAVVIGKGGRHIPKSDALAHVAGYSCYNDGSVRDWQKHTSQFLAGKNFIASGSFGPWLVAAAPDIDYRGFHLSTRLNGQVVQSASLSDLIFDLPTLIAYISTFTNLSPGDVIVTGTPDGVGSFREPQLWMRAGDVVEVDITGVGTLTNRIVAEGAVVRESSGKAETAPA